MSTPRKRILIFSLAYFPKFVGGAEVAVKEITDRLGESYDFDMVTLRLDSQLPRREKIGNVTVYRIGMSAPVTDIGRLPLRSKIAKLLMPISGLYTSIRLHRKNKYDIVWAIMANQAGFAALFFKWLYPNVKFLLTLQEGDPLDEIQKKVRYVLPLFKQIFRRADYIQPISNYLKDFALSMGYRGEMSVVPNGVDMSKYIHIYTDNQLKESLHISTNQKVIFTASRLVIKNGLFDLIACLKLLPHTYKLVVAGDGHLRVELQKYIDQCGLQDRVVMCGFVAPDILPCYYQIAHVFVRPSLSEGLGNVFLEAMAAKVPVIGTRVGGIPDIVHHQDTGLLVHRNNPAEIAQALLLLDSDPVLRESIVNNGYKMVQHKYDWAMITNQMDAIFISLMSTIKV